MVLDHSMFLFAKGVHVSSKNCEKTDKGTIQSSNQGDCLQTCIECSAGYSQSWIATKPCQNSFSSYVFRLSSPVLCISRARSIFSSNAQYVLSCFLPRQQTTHLYQPISLRFSFEIEKLCDMTEEILALLLIYFSVFFVSSNVITNVNSPLSSGLSSLSSFSSANAMIEHSLGVST